MKLQLDNKLTMMVVELSNRLVQTKEEQNVFSLFLYFK